MSSDLLEEFGNAEGNPWNQAPSRDVANGSSAVEDDFGEFENPVPIDNFLDTSTTAAACPRPARLSAEFKEQSLIAQDYVLSATAFTSGIDDEWGDFAQGSVLFETDEVAAGQNASSGHDVIDRHGHELSESLPKDAICPTTVLCPVSSSPVKSNPRQSFGVAKAVNTEQTLSNDQTNRNFEAIQKSSFEMIPPNVVPTKTTRATPPVEAKPRQTLPPPKAANHGPPPSNIPPPSVLLPLVTSFFGSLPTKTKSIASSPSKDLPKFEDSLRVSLSTIRAAARILAGRKLRWKRDTLLHQSMRIGPANSGKGGGMKLTGVDKAESRREDQEAAESLQAWKQQIGPLRAAVAMMNVHLEVAQRLNVPDVAENMLIRLGRPVEGVVSAPKCCFLCGIKRDERVAKVDVDVEDSFGEWWKEYWGHVDCVIFWEEHKDTLRQR